LGGGKRAEKYSIVPRRGSFFLSSAAPERKEASFTLRQKRQEAKAQLVFCQRGKGRERRGGRRCVLFPSGREKSVTHLVVAREKEERKEGSNVRLIRTGRTLKAGSGCGPGTSPGKRERGKGKKKGGKKGRNLEHCFFVLGEGLQVWR